MLPPAPHHHILMALRSSHYGGRGGPGKANMLPGTREASQHVGCVVAPAVAVSVVVVVVVCPRGGINDVTVRHPSQQRPKQPHPNPNPNPRHALADNNGWWAGDECSLLRVAVRVAVAVAVLLRFVQRGVWLTKLANIYQQLQRATPRGGARGKWKTFRVERKTSFKFFLATLTTAAKGDKGEREARRHPIIIIIETAIFDVLFESVRRLSKCFLCVLPNFRCNSIAAKGSARVDGRGVYRRNPIT